MTQDLIKRLDAEGAMGYWLREFYREGTWTPTIAGSSTAGTLTHDYRIGYYVRTGAQCTVWAAVRVSTVTVAPTGALVVSGLPFTSKNVTNFSQSVGMGQFLFVTLAASARAISVVIEPNTTAAILAESYNNGSTTGVDASLISNGCLLRFTATYLIEP
jgi:hypothetical protein